MATTPPIRTFAQTPSTPLYGAKYDEHRPRKSTRHSSSRVQRAIRTPPPNTDHSQQYSLSLDSKTQSTLRSAAHTYSPPSSTHTSPRKKTTKGSLVSPKAGARIMDGAGSSSEGGAHIDPIHNQDKNQYIPQPSFKAAANMLPTPVKTPRKKSVQAATVHAVARQLFPVIPVRPDSVEDAMPTPRKRRNRRNVGFSLYSSMENEEETNPEAKIQIYTDSKEKIPELVPTENNPFYEPSEDHASPPEPSKGRSSRKRRVAPTVGDRKEIKDAFDREEGMVYVFRGKKVFRKFPKEDEEEEDDSGLEADDCRPLTRSSIKPRLLFPTSKQRQEREAADIDDEEASTDIEELHDEVMTDPEQEHATPIVKQKVFPPATPPTTVHATRSSTKKAPEAVEAIPYKGKKVSPFDRWARTKASTSTSVGGGKGKKRDAEAMGSLDVAASHKKIKGNGTI